MYSMKIKQSSYSYDRPAAIMKNDLTMDPKSNFYIFEHPEQKRTILLQRNKTAHVNIPKFITIFNTFQSHRYPSKYMISYLLAGTVDEDGIMTGLAINGYRHSICGLPLKIGIYREHGKVNFSTALNAFWNSTWPYFRSNKNNQYGCYVDINPILNVVNQND